MKPVIMDFSGIYREEDFLGDRKAIWLELQELEGVNCYCDPEAEKEIRRRICDLSCEGIHFLDSGNYHYLSKFWLEKIQRPFSLLVFDNHTDMQEAAFYGLLSCGSWAGEVLDTQDFLGHICVAGPPEKDFQECRRAAEEKLTGICREALTGTGEQELLAFLEREPRLPLYISIDKDVLRREDARTNWDQGELSLDQLLSWLELAFDKRQVIGADICGEDPPDTARPLSGENLEINSRTNRILLEFLERKFMEQVILD